MTNLQKEHDRGESFGPVTITRRSMTKLAGMTGITLVTSSAVASTATANQEQVTIQQMNIQPTFDRILLQRIERDDKTDSGIIIPNSAQEVPDEGIVRATGDDAEAVEEGDHVLFEEEAGTEVVIAGEDHLIAEEPEILAVINV